MGKHHSRLPRYNRSPARREQKRLIVIATEGKKTEPIYFEALRGLSPDKALVIRVLPTKSGDTSPRAVLARLKGYARKVALGNRDSLWMVIDRDSWTEDDLSIVSEQCRALGYGLAVSNPSFELWLVLHQPTRRCPPSTTLCEAALTRLLGCEYDKSYYSVSKLVSNVNHAIAHARALHLDPDEKWPKSPGSHVYLLVEQLLTVG